MFFLQFICLFYFVRFSIACNGYSIKVTKYENCGENNVIKLPEKDFNVIMDKDCNVYGTGCVEITKDFNTAKGKYHVKKSPLPVIDGDINLCTISELLKKTPEIAAGINEMGIPTKCPVKAAKICGGPDHKFNLIKWKNQIGMGAGSSEVRLEIEHDTGKSCIEIFSTISKMRRG